MYNKNMGSESGPNECKPDYKEVAAKQSADLAVIKTFKCSLIAFIGIVGSHSFKREASSIPELIGTVELDILNRQKQYERTVEMIEKSKIINRDL